MLDRQPLTMGGSVTGSTNQEFADKVIGNIHKTIRFNIPLLHAIEGFPKYPGIHSQIPL